MRGTRARTTWWATGGCGGRGVGQRRGHVVLVAVALGGWRRWRQPALEPLRAPDRRGWWRRWPSDYVYKGATSALLGGPNHYQHYPVLNSVTESGGHTQVSVSLDASSGRSYRIDVCSQPSCESNSITPGQGAKWLGSDAVIGGATDDLAVLGPASDAITAREPNGNTSEFCPCLTVDKTAAAFTTSGVSTPSSTIDASSSSGPDSDTDARVSTKRESLYATVRPFCPPRTTGECVGGIMLHEAAHHVLLASLELTRIPLGVWFRGVTARDHG